MTYQLPFKAGWFHVGAIFPEHRTAGINLEFHSGFRFSRDGMNLFITDNVEVVNQVIPNNEFTI